MSELRSLRAEAARLGVHPSTLAEAARKGHRCAGEEVAPRAQFDADGRLLGFKDRSTNNRESINSHENPTASAVPAAMSPASSSSAEEPTGSGTGWGEALLWGAGLLALMGIARRINAPTPLGP